MSEADGNVAACVRLVLDENELRALLWLLKSVDAAPAFGDALRARRPIRPASLDELAQVRRAARALLARTLEAWRPRFGPRVCLRSPYLWQLVDRYGLRYLNHGSGAPSVYRRSHRATGAPQTLGDIPLLQDSMEKLDCAAEMAAAVDWSLVVQCPAKAQEAECG